MDFIYDYHSVGSNDDDIIKEFEMSRRFKSKNVIRERVDLYRDFTKNLLYYIYETYLGPEFIKTDDDIIGHFNWCFRKVVDEFLEEEIDFDGNDELFTYFFAYYDSHFYDSAINQSLNYHERFWDEIFEYKKPNKEKKKFELLVQLYQIFDTSLKKRYIEEFI